MCRCRVFRLLIAFLKKKPVTDVAFIAWSMTGICYFLVLCVWNGAEIIPIRWWLVVWKRYRSKRGSRLLLC